MTRMRSLPSYGQVDMAAHVGEVTGLGDSVKTRVPPTCPQHSQHVGVKTSEPLRAPGALPLVCAGGLIASLVLVKD